MIFIKYIKTRRNVFRGFYYYTVLSVPGLFSGLSIFLVPATKRYIFITSLCCAVSCLQEYVRRTLIGINFYLHTCVVY